MIETPAGEGGEAAMDGDESACMTIDVDRVADARLATVWMTHANGDSNVFNRVWRGCPGAAADSGGHDRPCRI